MATTPLPTIEEKNKQAATPEPEAAKQSRNAETDAYITAHKEEKRKKRGGIQERIDELTRKADDARKEAEEAKRVAQEAANKPAHVLSVPSVSTDTGDRPDPRPKREAFTDEAEFTTKIAEWVVRQQNKIIARPAANSESNNAQVQKTGDGRNATEIQYNPADPSHVALKTEFDGFMTTGREYIKTHADFNDRLNDAAKRGLTLDNAAQRAIIKLKAPEVLYYLASPENESVARALMSKTAVEQVVEIGLLYEKLQVKASDFISSAGRPGTRLTNGSTRATIPLSEMDTDDYIRQRREDIRAGRRRR